MVIDAFADLPALPMVQRPLEPSTADALATGQCFGNPLRRASRPPDILFRDTPQRGDGGMPDWGTLIASGVTSTDEREGRVDQAIQDVTIYLRSIQQD